MGYNTQKLNDLANKSMGACFVTVGSKGVALTSLVPQGIGTSQGAIITLQLLSSGGATTNSYEYYNGSKKPAYKNNNGWYDLNQNFITAENDVYFAPGQGFWVNCVQEGVTLQNSGEVFFDSVTWGLNGFANTMLANPYPMDLKLSNITVGGASTSQGAIITLQLLSSGGSTTNSYEYYYGSKKPAYKNNNGWYDLEQNFITADNDVTFPAGQGFWVNAAQEGLTLTFSSGEDVTK